MKTLLLGALLSATALAGVAGADPLVCNEPWYKPQPHPPHLSPCHEQAPAEAHAARAHPAQSRRPGNGFDAAPADTDLLCGFTSVSDPNPESPQSIQTGELDGGPIAQNGTITCTIQVGYAGLHSDPDNGAKASATGTNGVTILNPTVVSYVSPPWTNVYVCDQFADSSGTTYVYDDVDGAWEFSGSSSAACRIAVSASTSEPAVEGLNESAGDAADAVSCPVLAGLAGLSPVITIGPDGDVYANGEPVWTCAPY